MQSVKNLLLVISTGYIFMYFSEHLFWARARPGDSLFGWLGAWAAYSLLAFIFLLIVSYFHIRAIWSLFLAGAVFGWLAEGLVVQTAYETLPLSISFTGLAWHALITVWVGWYLIRAALHSSPLAKLLQYSIFIGLAYGLWAISWWLEPDGGVSSILDFTIYSFSITGLVILAYWLADWSSTAPFAPAKWVVVLTALLFTLYFIFVTIPAAPIAAILLPLLLVLTYWGLNRSRQKGEGSLADAAPRSIPVWKYAALLAIPASAAAVYGLAFTFHVQWHTNLILYLITTPAGFVLFVIGLYKGVSSDKQAVTCGSSLCRHIWQKTR